MKKVNFLKISLALLIIGSIFFVSCNNEDDNSNNQSNQIINNNNMLLKKLNDFNVDFESNASHSTHTKKIDWKRVFKIAGADIVGAAGGYIFGAITLFHVPEQFHVGYLCATSIYGAGQGSYAAGITNAPEINPRDVNYGKLNIKIPSEYAVFSNVGVEHNNVIHKYFYQKGDIKEYYQNLDPESISLLNSRAFNKNCEFIKDASIEYASNDFDYRLLTQRYLDEGLFTENMKNVTDLFLTSIFTCNDTSDLEIVINFYIKAVEESKLKSDEKKALISSFIVASESPFYLAGN